MRRETRQAVGFFVTFEGVEGSGKSTQCARLAKALREQGETVVETREPGGTRIAEAIRRLLLQEASAEEPLTAVAEAALILAARSQHVAEVIRPALAAGAIVLCDRFSDSTLAYQGYARGIDRGLLKQLTALASGRLRPHLTLLFDVPAEVGLARRRRESQHGGEENRLDRESLTFHRRVRQGFLALAREQPRRIVLLDGTRDPDAVAEAVRRVVSRRLPRRRGRRRANHAV